MSYDDIKDEIALAASQTAIDLLVRDTMLAQTVWRDPVTDFAHKQNETVSVYLPAYAVANKRDLRANDNRARSTLKERKVDIALTNDLQVDVALTDENQTLDIRSIATSVVAPAIGAIVRAYDEELAAVMEAADYEVTVEWDSSDPYESLVDARVALDRASVPATGRFLVVGSELAAQLLKDNLLVAANTAGSTQTLRAGVIGQVASFDVLTSAFLAPDVGVAYHRTAFALCSRAPAVPDGVGWGQTQSADGFAIRVMQHLGQNGSGDLQNIIYHDSWFGVSEVTDAGALDEDGRFIPAVDPEGVGQDDLFVRAVKLAATGS